MNYEKAYKEALERAREFQKSKDGLCVLTAESIFPELKESEDEKIRKTLLESFEYQIKESYPDKEWLCGVKLKEIVAWLEKHGEQKVPINDFKAKNWYVSEVDGKIHDMTYNPADKVEPKFKVGDWIVNNITKDVFLIKSINNGYCTLEDIKGNIIFPCLPFESDFHLWTINDAKDGDVLVDNLGNICIYEEPSTKLMYHSYCYGKYNYFVDMGGSHEIVGTCPATKEQRNILFQRMKEAGYEWDAEKKVFKMIDENSKCDAVEYVYILDYSTGRVMVVKHSIKESIEDLFKRLGLKESQCHYMVSDKILSIEYINF